MTLGKGCLLRMFCSCARKCDKVDMYEVKRNHEKGKSSPKDKHDEIILTLDFTATLLLYHGMTKKGIIFIN